MDAALEFVEDEDMAAAAGLGVLGLEMERSGRLDIVDAVTVRADGGEGDEALVEQGPAVDARPVFAVRKFGVNVVLDDDRHVLVASGAGRRDVGPVDHRGGVCPGLDVVLAVAVPAPGHLGFSALEVAAAVDAVGVSQGRRAGRGRRFGPVALRGAVGRRKVFLGRMREVAAGRLGPGVAVETSQGLVDGVSDFGLRVTGRAVRLPGPPRLGRGFRGLKACRPDRDGENGSPGQDDALRPHDVSPRSRGPSRPPERQPPSPEGELKRRGGQTLGTGCLIFSTAAAKSKVLPWAFSWHFRHWALTASALG